MGTRRDPLIGRARELADVAALVGARPGHLVTLTGRGGVGKTRLALAVADVLAARPGWRSVTVPLAPVQDPDRVPAEVARALGVAALPGGSLLEAVRQRVGDDDVVLVVDNLEHLLDAAPFVVELGGCSPGLHVLVTSQAPLRAHGEAVVAVEPFALDLEAAHDLEGAAAQPSIDLYCRRAAVADPTFLLDDRNVAAVVEVCHRLEGLPLALELAAARVRTLPPAELARRLATGQLDVLASAPLGEHDRHRDLRAAITWSCEAVPPEVATLFGRLSVPSSSFDLDDVELLAEGLDLEPLAAFGTLVDFRLVEPMGDRDPPRFLLQPSIREVAAERLVGEERAAVLERWDRWCARRARAAALGVDTADQTAWRAWTAAAVDDLVAATRRCLAAGRTEVALDLLGALGPHWLTSELSDASAALLDDAVARGLAEGIESASMAEAMAWSGGLGLAFRQGRDRDRDLEVLAGAEAMARRIDDRRAWYVALSCWLRCAPVLAAIDPATAGRAAEGLERARDDGDELWQARFEIWTGMLAHVAHDDERALALGRAGLARARRTGDVRSMVPAYMLLSPLAARYPDIDVELPPLQAVIDEARATRQVQLLAGLLPLATMLALDAGDRDDAQRWWLEALELVRTLPSTVLTTVVLAAGVLVAAAAGEPATAARLQGAVDDNLAIVDAARSPEATARHRALVERLRADLGTEAFDREHSVGRTIGPEASLDAALTFARRLRQAGAKARPTSPDGLTDRQIEVVQLLADGLTNKEIAARLGVTPKTVMHHTTAIYRRIGARSRSEAAAWALRSGLVD